MYLYKAYKHVHMHLQSWFAKLVLNKHDPQAVTFFRDGAA